PAAHDARAELLGRVAGRRPIVPRLTGGFRWAPANDIRRGGAMRGSNGTLAPEVLGYLASADADRLQHDATVADLGRNATAEVLTGQLDAGVATLARAAAAAPASAEVESDLAAARLARGERDGSAEDTVAALE